MTAPQPVILSAGSVITMTGHDATTVVVEGERIAFVGSLGSAQRRFPRGDVIDYGPDAAILPGFHDAHSHPEIVAENSLYVQLTPSASDDREELATQIAARAAQVGPGAWVRAVGFRPRDGLRQATIDADILDRICPRNPVYITHVSSHWGVANNLAMASLGIGREPGGDRHGLGESADGRLTGVVFEQRHFDAVFPALAKEEPRCPRAPEPLIAANLRSLLVEYASLGITSTVDALGWPGSFALYEQLAADRELPVRVGLLITHRHLASMAELRARCRDDRLRIIGVKLFADGALSGGTCLLDDPYAHAADYTGDQVLSADELSIAMGEVLEAGWSPAVHANGDLAVHRVLDAFEEHRSSARTTGARLRIEHCSLVRAADLPRLAAAGAVPVLFGTFIGVHGDVLLNLYGEERAQRMIAARSLLDAGLNVAASSDSPAAPVPPLRGISDLVTRRAPSGRLVGASQEISVQEAIGLYTTGAAYAAGIERTLGRIERGFLADLVVLASDPRRVDADRIADIDVVETWMGGRKVWSINDHTSACSMP